MCRFKKTKILNKNTFEISLLDHPMHKHRYNTFYTKDNEIKDNKINGIQIKIQKYILNLKHSVGLLIHDNGKLDEQKAPLR